MAKYSYNELKVAAAEGRRIGGYQGKNVFAASRYNYDTKRHSDNFYVLYDEDNKLVYKGIVYGTISEKGLVDEWERKCSWVAPMKSSMTVNFEPVSPGKSKISQKSIPATGYSAMVAEVDPVKGGIVDSANFFADLDRQINELLATPFDAGDMPWVQG